MEQSNFAPQAITFVTIDGISPNPFQPPSRLQVDAATAEKFGRSIMENGLQQYPIVRAKECDFEIIDGWRRLAGYRWLVQHEHMELYRNMPVIVVERTDKQMAEDILETGTVRDELTPLDLAHLYKRMQDELDITQEEIAKKHNCSQGEIANTIRLLELPDEYQKMLISHEITETHARTLLQLLKFPAEMAQLAARVRDEHLTVNALEFEIKNLLHKETKPRKTVQIERNATPPAHTPPPPVKKQEATKPTEQETDENRDALNKEGETHEIKPPVIVQVNTAPRKLTLNETGSGNVFAGVMKLGKQGFFKTLPGTLETADVGAFLSDAEEYWKGAK